MKFSERMGFVEVNTVIQTEGMGEELRNSLWNLLDKHLWSSNGFIQSNSRMRPPHIHRFSRTLWSEYFKKPVDTVPKSPSLQLAAIRDHFFNCEWFRVYDFIEFLARLLDNPNLFSEINTVLTRELSGFRLIDGLITPINDELEKEAIEEALTPDSFSGAQTHLKQALTHLANREAPDYRNSIKESISAVESLACELTGEKKAVLGDALRVLEKEHQLHGALKQGFASLYGYTSDADGIRHGILNETNLDANDAKFFLVSCSAFINYLKSKSIGPT